MARGTSVFIESVVVSSKQETRKPVVVTGVLDVSGSRAGKMEDPRRGCVLHVIVRPVIPEDVHDPKVQLRERAEARIEVDEFIVRITRRPGAARRVEKVAGVRRLAKVGEIR